MAIIPGYMSRNYRPELVTGVYVRFDGAKRGFKVIEAATGTGRFAGKLGHGPTLREYYTDGAELPDDIREKARLSCVTELWKYLPENAGHRS